MPITNETTLKVKYGSTDINLINLPIDDGSLVYKAISDTNFKLYVDNINRKELTVSNSDTSTKLKTARNIGIIGDASGSSTALAFDGSSDGNIKLDKINESALIWSTTGYSPGTVTPIAGAMSNLHNANRFAFANPAGIIIEYSNDSGNTWKDYGNIDIRLFSGTGGASYAIGKVSDVATIADQLRVTLQANKMGVYTLLVKLLINISTNGADNCFVRVEYSNQGSEDVFKTYETFPIQGQPGWNVIPIPSILFGGESSKTSNWHSIRLTFSISSVSSNYSNILNVLDILGFGTICWQYPSNMARTGHLYSYDYNQNANFPGQISTRANGFFEAGYSCGLDLKNSDIRDTHSIYFTATTVSQKVTRGLNFLSSNNIIDTFRSYAGNLEFSPQRTRGETENITTYTVMDSSGKVYSQNKEVLVIDDKKWQTY